MTSYAVMRENVGRFKKGQAYEILDHDEGDYDLGNDEWVQRSQFKHVSGDEALRIIEQYMMNVS